LGGRCGRQATVTIVHLGMVSSVIERGSTCITSLVSDFRNGAVKVRREGGNCAIKVVSLQFDSTCMWSCSNVLGRSAHALCVNSSESPIQNAVSEGGRDETQRSVNFWQKLALNESKPLGRPAMRHLRYWIAQRSTR
jgi:hypothetical protein